MLCKHIIDSDDNIINIITHSDNFIWYDTNGTVPKQYNAKGKNYSLNGAVTLDTTTMKQSHMSE